MARRDAGSENARARQCLHRDRPTDAVNMSSINGPVTCGSIGHSVSLRCRPRFTVSFRKHTAARSAELCELRTGRSGIEGDHDPMDICVLSEKTLRTAGSS
jgi:hypothetical protein